MTLLTTFRYGRGDGSTAPRVESDALTRALDAGIGHVASLRWRALGPVRHFDRWTHAARRASRSVSREAPWRR